VPPRFNVRVGAVSVGEVLEDEEADDAAERAADSGLTVEKGQAAAKFEARVEERQVRYRDGVEAGWDVLAR
jgi:hypothetical protein